MRTSVVLILAGAFILGAASMPFAAAPATAAGNQATNMASPQAGAARGNWDDFFRSPATPQDLTLAQTITARLQQWKDPSLVQAAPAGGGPACGLCGVTVEARNGYIRLSGRVSGLQQGIAAENIARGTQGAAMVINALVVGK